MCLDYAKMIFVTIVHYSMYNIQIYQQVWDATNLNGLGNCRGRSYHIFNIYQFLIDVCYIYNSLKHYAFFDFLRDTPAAS